MSATLSRKTRSAENSKRAEAPGSFLSDVAELRRRARVFEWILGQEEEHADDLADPLKSFDGEKTRP